VSAKPAQSAPEMPVSGGDRPGWVPLRGASGRLYGYYDPATQSIEVKRKGEQPERIALGHLLKR
jgi:hypothetical protein